MALTPLLWAARRKTPAPASSAIPDSLDVGGQPMARRALEIAAAGCHADAPRGRRDAEKPMLAERLPGISRTSRIGALDATRIYGSSGERALAPPLLRRPSPAPHPSITRGGLLGGESRGRGRSRSRTTACFSSTNSPNSGPRYGRRSGSRSNRGRSASRAPATGTGSRAGSCCWRRPTLARAATRDTPGRSAGAPRRSSIGFRGSFRGPFSTGSTTRSPCFRSRSRRGPRGARRIVGGGPAPGRGLPCGSGGTVRGARLPDERDRPRRDGGAVAGAHAGGGGVPHAGGGTALPVGKGDREGVPRGEDDRRPRRRATGRAPPRRGSPPVPPVGIRGTGGSHAIGHVCSLIARRPLPRPTSA